MNSEMQRIVREAEGRHLSADEQEVFVAYAEGMGERLTRARAVQESEEEIIDKTRDRLLDRFPGLDLGLPRHDALLRELRLHLRYVAGAHVRDDLSWFSQAHAEWVAELGLARFEPELLRVAFEALGSSMAAVLDAVDVAVLEPFHAVLVRQLGGR